MSRLHIDSITKSFGNKKILQDIFMSCETGKITGLLGRNGTGKSTLLQIIFGTVKGDTQFIRFNNTVLKNQSDRRNRIGYLPQQPFLPKNIKIKKLVDLFCSNENKEKIYDSELIKPLLNKTPGKLSEGERKIVEALLIIYSNTEFVLLDEPFNALSPKITEIIEKIIKEQSKQKGIIISDHRYQSVINISDDIYLLIDTYLKPIKEFQELKLFNYLPKDI